MEIRITDPTTGGMKGQKLEQYSLVDPELRERMLSFWPKDGRTRLAHILLDFETGYCSSRVLVEEAYEWLYECIPSHGLATRELARVFGHGSRKYERANWRKGYAWSLSIDAMWRHIIAGRTNDEESGLHHAAHALWHALALRDFDTMSLGTDDRLFMPPPRTKPYICDETTPAPPECCGCGVWPPTPATEVPWREVQGGYVRP